MLLNPENGSDSVTVNSVSLTFASPDSVVAVGSGTASSDGSGSAGWTASYPWTRRPEGPKR